MFYSNTFYFLSFLHFCQDYCTFNFHVHHQMAPDIAPETATQKHEKTNSKPNISEPQPIIQAEKTIEPEMSVVKETVETIAELTNQSEVCKEIKNMETNSLSGVVNIDQLELEFQPENQLEPAFETENQLELVCETENQLEPTLKTESQLEPELDTENQLEEPAREIEKQLETDLQLEHQLEDMFESNEQSDQQPSGAIEASPNNVVQQKPSSPPKTMQKMKTTELQIGKEEEHNSGDEEYERMIYLASDDEEGIKILSEDEIKSEKEDQNIITVLLVKVKKTF